MESIQREAAEARQHAKDIRSPGAKLDSAHAALKRAEAAAEAAAAAVTAAEEAHEKAQAALLQARERAREAEAAAKSMPVPPKLIPNVSVLADVLVKAITTQGGPLPFSVQAAVEAMQDGLRKAAGDDDDDAAVHASQPPAASSSVQAQRMPPEQRGQVRSADEASLSSREGGDAPPFQDQRGDDILMELEDGEDSSDAALADMVRRYRARRRM